MAEALLSAERELAAPAAVVYRCLADYQRHHRPAPGFLPPAFTRLRVERGGVGAGTRFTFTTRTGGGTRSATQDVSEPEPGRVLMETGDGITTTFTVEPRDPDRCHIRIHSRFEAKGLSGLLTRLLVPRLLRPVYADELERLERYAQGQATDPTTT